eukprot:Clim_evm28s11 gene=Clim_evmTU28s11
MMGRESQALADLVDCIADHENGDTIDETINDGLESFHSHRKVIIHIDLDCFYAQVEMIRDPLLRDVPLGIQQKNIIVTCNYPARKYGVGKLQFIADAVAKCPHLRIISGSEIHRYRLASREIYKLVKDEIKGEPFVPVEKLVMDEMFLDVTDLVHSMLEGNGGESQTTSQGRYAFKGHVFGPKRSSHDEGVEEIADQSTIGKDCTDGSCGCHERLAAGSEIAARIRQRMKSELGYGSCAGVGHSKLMAKLISGRRKPDHQCVILADGESALIRPLQIRKVPGIGYSTTSKLRAAFDGLETIAQLQELSLKDIETVCAPRMAKEIYRLARGVDLSPVIQHNDAPKSISEEDSFLACTEDCDLRERIEELLRYLLTRLDEDRERFQRAPTVFRLHARKSRQRRESRQCQLPPAIFSATDMDNESRIDKLLELSLGLFRKIIPKGQEYHLTLLGVTAASFEPFESNRLTKYFSIGNCDEEKDADKEPLQRISPLPDGIDPEVWESLPSEIQQEIQRADAETLGMHLEPQTSGALKRSHSPSPEASEQPPLSKARRWKCPDCQLVLPTYAIEAHRRYHTDEDGDM